MEGIAINRQNRHILDKNLNDMARGSFESNDFSENGDFGENGRNGD